MLATESNGSGIPIVLLHAFPLNRTMWQSTVDILKRNFQVIAMDFPGFGESPLQKDPSTMAEMAREVLDTLDSLSIQDRAVMVGVSMGGYVLFQLHKLEPARLRALVFVSTRSSPDTEDVKERRKRTADMVQEKGLASLAEQMIPNLFGKSSLKANIPSIEVARKQIVAANASGVCAALRGMAIRPDSTHFLQTINIPTLVISGEEDTVIPAAEMSLMAGRIARARFERIPLAGHLVPIEQPETFHSTLLNFLKRSVL